ncbi:RidA family protein [Ochrobactrum sp. EDr1-4]|uniref:RidA family protein n=1 Tax=Ochrobactrum sp. EDr1-4 TaxID=3368622 RepID=UPI003B9F0C29
MIGLSSNSHEKLQQPLTAGVTMITRFDETDVLSKVLVANGFAFLSGLTPKDRNGDVKTQTLDILNQIDGYLAKAGTNKSKLVSVNIWLKNIDHFDDMNEAWKSWIDPSALPARATVEARLADEDILVEIMAKALV